MNPRLGIHTLRWYTQVALALALPFLLVGAALILLVGWWTVPPVEDIEEEYLGS